MSRLSKLLSIFIFSLVLANSGYAWNNDYQSSQNYDSYSQSWNSYKQQNNIKTEAYVQQSWWSKTITNVGNFFSSAANTISKIATNVGSFFTNAQTALKIFC